MPTLNGANYSYEQGSYDEGIDENGPWVSVNIICNWNDRFGIQNSLMGLNRVTGGPGGPLTITRPQVWPDSINLWAHDTRLVRPVGNVRLSPKGGVQYDEAVIAVNYRVPKFDVQGNDNLNAINQAPLPFFRMSYRTGEEEIPLAPNSLVFASGANANTSLGSLGLNFHMTVPTAEFVFTRLILPYLPSQEVIDLLNFLNDDTWYGVPKGHARFSAISSTYERQTDGSGAQDMEFVFQIKPYDWNSVWSPTAAEGFKPVWSDSSNKFTPYGYASFDPIFAE